MPHVSHLFSYPLKSAKGISWQQCQTTSWGLQFDRNYMLVDQNGKFLSQRTHPQIALIKIESITPKRVTFKFPEKRALSVEPSLKNEAIGITVWNDSFKALAFDDRVDLWFSEIIGDPCRLVYMNPEVTREVDNNYAPTGHQTAFSDGFPFLLLSQASLNLLNSKLEYQVGFERFRPNIVIDGCDAHAEDQWKSIEINGVRFDLVKPCSRCIIVNTDQEFAERGKEPLHTLSQYRKDGNKVYFGQNAIHHNNGLISLGDEVKVLA